MRACMIAPTKIIAGLGMSLGMHYLTVPGATGAVLSLTCPQQVDLSWSVLTKAQQCPSLHMCRRLQNSFACKS